MKKGCLIVLLILGVLVAGGLGFAGVQYRNLNRDYGLSMAEPVSHETLVAPDTRLRALLQPDKLIGTLMDYVPQGSLESKLPSWIPMNLEESLPKVLPREVALLANPNYAAGDIDMTLFVNERRGGPAVMNWLNENNPLADIPMVKWDPALVQMPERGTLTLDAALNMPAGIEENVLEHWSHDPPAAPLSISGEHALEVVLDNRNGASMVLAATISELNGQSWEQLRNKQEFGLVLGFLKAIQWIRLGADVTARDEITIKMHIDSKNNLEFIHAMAFPELQNTLKKDTQLDLQGSAKWNEKQSALVGTYTLTGYDKLIRPQVAAALGTPSAS